jgi:hypothetical protein
METPHNPSDEARERLVGELADVEASIALVADGAVSSVTLTSLRFGRQLAEQFGPQAERLGVHLDATFWPEDAICDLRVHRAEGLETHG